MRDVLEELLDEDEEQDEEEQTALTRVERVPWRARKTGVLEAEHAAAEVRTQEEDAEQEKFGEKRVRDQGMAPVHRENARAEASESERSEEMDPVSMLSLKKWAVEENTSRGRAVVRAVEQNEQTARETRLEAALGRVRRSSVVQSEVEREFQRRQVAEHLYEQLRRTQSAAEYRGVAARNGGAVLTKPGETVRAAVEPGQLDRAFERDARRYDGGFQWL